MKIIDWTNWDNTKYKEMFSYTEERDWDAIDKIETIISEELRKHGYKFTGDYHQNGEYGVPVFDNGTVYHCTQRTWGSIMARAYPEEIDNKDEFAHCVWAWVAPHPMIIPNPNDYIGE